MINRLVKRSRKLIPETQWCITERAVACFYRRRRWTSSSYNRWGTSATLTKISVDFATERKRWLRIYDMVDSRNGLQLIKQYFEMNVKLVIWLMTCSWIVCFLDTDTDSVTFDTEDDSSEHIFPRIQNFCSVFNNYQNYLLQMYNCWYCRFLAYRI